MIKQNKKKEDIIKRLTHICGKVRKNIVWTLGELGTGHSGPSLSIVEILVVLYFYEMKVDPKEPNWHQRDIFVLSKGHGALGLYAVLAERGFFSHSELETFESLGSILQGHPDARLTPGVELSTGSLGQGLSFTVGTAIAAKLQKRDYRSYCLIGDGESQEGNIWEAAMSASKYHLDNLVCIVDYNGIQGGITKIVMPSLEPFADKWRAFGWNVIELSDGHNLSLLIEGFSQARKTMNIPTIIIAHTIKGKGVSFMENNPEWHSNKLEGEYKIRAYEEVGL